MRPITNWEYIQDNFLLEAFDDLESYLLAVDKFISTEISEGKSLLETEIDLDVDPNIIEDMYVERRIEHEKMEREFPSNLYTGVLTSTFSLLELRLDQYCLRMNELHYSEIKRSDMAGSGINQIKKYLNKVHGIDVSTASWTELVTISKIRNISVHELGIITEEKTCKLFNEYANKVGGIAFEPLMPHFADKWRLLLGRVFCQHVISFSKKFLRELNAIKISKYRSSTNANRE